MTQRALLCSPSISYRGRDSSQNPFSTCLSACVLSQSAGGGVMTVVWLFWAAWHDVGEKPSVRGQVLLVAYLAHSSPRSPGVLRNLCDVIAQIFSNTTYKDRRAAPRETLMQLRCPLQQQLDRQCQPENVACR